MKKNSLIKTECKFTLVELLSAFVVIAILMTMLLPGLTRTKEYAKQTDCMNNLRQIAIAYKNYLVENNDEMPYIERWLDDFTPTYAAIRNLKVYKCMGINTPLLTDPSQLNPATATETEVLTGQVPDYYTSGSMTDFDRNNGHGNNPYHLDIGNKGSKVDAIKATKKDARMVYDKNWASHFKGLSFNVVYIDDLHYEKEFKGVSQYWTLDDRYYMETSLDPFPTYTSNGSSKK